MNDCMTNETPLVLGARMASVGMLKGVILPAVTEKFETQAARKLIRRNHRTGAGNEVAERNQLARGIESQL